MTTRAFVWVEGGSRLHANASVVERIFLFFQISWSSAINIELCVQTQTLLNSDNELSKVQLISVFISVRACLARLFAFRALP